LKNALFKLEFLVIDMTNELIVTDFPNLVSESIKKLSHCHTRDIPKSIYKPKFSSKAKYTKSHFVFKNINHNQIYHL
jgi:hypothetical protein